MAGTGAVKAAVPPSAQPLEQRLRDAGLELLGPCERMSQRPSLMQHSALLHDFSAAEVDVLGGAMLRVRGRAGQVLIQEDEASDWMMLLLEGTVDVTKRKVGAPLDAQEPGDTTRLAVLKAGATVGEMSMLDGEPRYASCTALQDIEGAVLSRAAVGHLIAAQPAVGAKLLVKLTQLLAQRLRNTSNQVVRLLQRQASEAGEEAA